MPFAVGSKVREKIAKHFPLGRVLDVLNKDNYATLVCDGQIATWILHDQLEQVTQPTTSVLLCDPNRYNWPT